MNWTTIGKNYYPGYHHLMQVSCHEELVTQQPLCSRYQLILVEEGSGALQIGGDIFSISYPSIICLNEVDALLPLAGTQIRAKSTYFNPQVINRRFDFPMCFDNKVACPELTETDGQDLWCMLPFRKSFFCSLDPMYAKHVSQIMQDIDKQLAEQLDSGWPCRSRSYLLELLSLVSRIYYLYEVDGLRIAYLGALGQDELTEEQLKQLGKVDIVLAYFFDAPQWNTKKETTVKAIQQIKPALVLPTEFSEDAAKFIMDSLQIKELKKQNELLVNPDDIKSIKATEFIYLN